MRSRQLWPARLIAAAGTLGLFLAVATPATAADKYELVFNEDEITVAYGDPWQLSVTMKKDDICIYGNDKCTNRIQVTDSVSGETVKTSPYQSVAHVGSYEFAVLDVGRHEFSAKFKRYKREGSSSNSGVIVVTPAQIAVDLRVDSDDSNRRGAIVNAQLTGEYMDRTNCYECVPSVSPAGVWTFTVTDTDGATVIEKEISSEKVASQFASFYWSDIPASSDFVASASFAPSGGASQNFEVAADKGVAFTSPPAPESADVGAPPAEVREEPADVAPASVPLWTVLASGALLLLLLIAAVVLLNRGHRRSRPIDSNTTAGVPA